MGSTHATALVVFTLPHIRVRRSGGHPGHSLWLALDQADKLINCDATACHGILCPVGEHSALGSVPGAPSIHFSNPVCVGPSETFTEPNLYQGGFSQETATTQCFRQGRFKRKTCSRIVDYNRAFPAREGKRNLENKGEQTGKSLLKVLRQSTQEGDKIEGDSPPWAEVQTSWEGQRSPRKCCSRQTCRAASLWGIGVSHRW